MITREQVKAARALLGWRQVDLAVASGASLIAIKQYESAAVESRESTLTKIKIALTEAGIEVQPGGVRITPPAE